MIRNHLPHPVFHTVYANRRRPMEDKTTTQKIAELKTLCGDVKGNMYQRVKLAFEILADVDWIEHAHRGKTSRAMDFLQHEGFPYITLTVGQLAAIYRKWPEESMWKEWDYDVNTMWGELRSDAKPTRKTTKVVHWKEKAEELRSELDELKRSYAKLEQMNAELKGELRGIKETLVGAAA